MPIKSRFHASIPPVDLPTYLFSSPNTSLSEKPLYVSAKDPTINLTQKTYRLYAQRLALGLQRAGLQSGDRVLLFAPNSIFFPVVLLGTVMAAGIFTGANPGYVARELAYQLTDSGATFMITSRASLDTALEAAHGANLDPSRVFVMDDDEGAATFTGDGDDVGKVRHWSSLLAPAEDAAKFSWEKLSGSELDRTIALNYSSGTTGRPKGVMITHRNYVSNAEQTIAVAKADKLYEERNARARWLAFVPMYHAMGQTIFCCAAAKRGIPVYVMKKFDFLGMLECVQRFRITDLTLVPPVIVAMAKHPACKSFDLSSVERIGCGAAPLGREVCAELEKLWPDRSVNVKQGWGMTEATCSVTIFHPETYSDSFSVGEISPNCEAKIVDENGNEVPRGSRGEIWVRGPIVMKGYWNNPRATQETVTQDGWLRTGDIAYVDKDGLFFIVDRMKELIKVKGNQVAPAELEALLLDHEGVADAAVIGVTIDGEEVPRAYIVKTAGIETTAEDIHMFMKARVSKTKQLVGGVRFVDAIPKNPSGKITRNVLREQAKKEVEITEAPRARL
ncbi:acetyl-CoA synthetase-like protein [Saccharata proteae CBS 121410]|uniref:Acetyl-CoA synthetase-like protein n=1 Tax=Saccharata proteae CBS 121410 TaxID=1314787 RepID=A0A9P4LVE1_9PEZI|nr:acetyl-CoA synthetase-like protein [Saccharata proteae CBS 121410]